MSIFTKIIDKAVGAIKLVKEHAKFTDVLGYLYGNLSDIIGGVLAVTGSDSETKIRQAWEEFDLRTGEDSGAVRIARNLPPEAEERMLDGFKQFGCEFSLWKAGIYGEPPTEEDFQRTLAAVAMAAKPLDNFRDNGKPAEPALRMAPVDSAIMQQLQTIAITPERYSSEQKSRVFAKALLLLIEYCHVK